MNFPSAAKRFFGLKPGETLQEFAAELKQLTPADKEELCVLLSKELGEEVTLGTTTH